MGPKWHCMVRVPLAGSSEPLPLKISDNNHPTWLKNSSLENFLGVERAGKPGRWIVRRWGCGCAPSLAAGMAAFPGPGNVQERNHSRDSPGVLLQRDLSVVSMVQTVLLQSGLAAVRAGQLRVLYPLAGTGCVPAGLGLSLGLSAPARVRAGSAQVRAPGGGCVLLRGAVLVVPR